MAKKMSVRDLAMSLFGEMRDFDEHESELYQKMFSQDPVIVEDAWADCTTKSNIKLNKTIRRIDFDSMLETNCQICDKLIQKDEKIIVSLKMQDDIPSFIAEKEWDKEYCPECFMSFIEEISDSIDIYYFCRYCYVQYSKYREDILIILNNALCKFIQNNITELR